MTRQEAIQQAKNYIMSDAVKFLNTSNIMNCVASLVTDYDRVPERSCQKILEEIELFTKGLEILTQTVGECQQKIIDADE